MCTEKMFKYTCLIINNGYGLFLCPHINRLGHIVFSPPICPFICMFVRKNFYIGHIFRLVRLTAFSIPCDKTFLLIPSSRSSVKVKYQGHSFKKNCSFGDIGVSQTQLVFYCCLLNVDGYTCKYILYMYYRSWINYLRFQRIIG